MSYKSQVRRNFNRAAQTYSQKSQLQNALARRLLSIKPDCKPKRILDAGSGTGNMSYELQSIYPSGSLFNIDLAHSMLRANPRGISVCGDLEKMPFAPACFDLIVSNAALQWCCDTAAVLKSMRRILGSKGYLLFAFFGAGTLKELANSWRHFDTFQHILDFPSEQDLLSSALENDMEIDVLHHQREVVLYDNAYALFATLKQFGASNCHPQHRSGLTSPSRLDAVANHYAKQYSLGDQIIASYEIIFLRARALY